MKSQLINFFTILAILYLTGNLSFFLQKFYVFYFGIVCGVCFFGFIDLVDNYINKDE